jgi:hypothetical protein
MDGFGASSLGLRSAVASRRDPGGHPGAETGPRGGFLLQRGRYSGWHSRPLWVGTAPSRVSYGRRSCKAGSVRSPTSVCLVPTCALLTLGLRTTSRSVMNILTRLLSVVVLATATFVPLQSATAWEGRGHRPASEAHRVRWSRQQQRSCRAGVPRRLPSGATSAVPVGRASPTSGVSHRDTAWGRRLDSLYSALGPGPRRRPNPFDVGRVARGATAAGATRDLGSRVGRLSPPPVRAGITGQRGSVRPSGTAAAGPTQAAAGQQQTRGQPQHGEAEHGERQDQNGHAGAPGLSAPKPAALTAH